MLAGLFNAGKALGGWGIALLAGGGAVAATNVALNPKDGLVVNTITDIWTAAGNAAKESAVDTGFQGFYKFFEKLAEFIESFTGKGSMLGMTNWARRGMGEGELSHQDANATVGNGATTENTDPGAITYTPENALTLENFSNFEGALSGDNLIHKTNVFAHGVAEGTTSVVNIAFHAADGADWLLGKGASLFGYDTGYADRNISAAAKETMMSGVNTAWDTIGTVPELNTAWDRAVHFTGELAPAIATGYAFAPAVSNAFLGAATTPALNATVGTTLGNTFTSAVAKTGLATTTGVVLNAGGLAIAPALNNG